MERAFFEINNVSSTASTLLAINNGTSINSKAIEARNDGGGDAGDFAIVGGGGGAAVIATTDGTGPAMNANKVVGGTGPAAFISHDGASGTGLQINLSGGTNTSPGLEIFNAGTGPDIQAAAGSFIVDNTGGTSISPSAAIDGLFINQNTTARGMVVNMNGGLSPGIEVASSGGPSIITDGDVGIGISSPASRLHVEVGVGTAIVEATSNVKTGLLQIRNNDGVDGDASMRFDMNAGQFATVGIDQSEGNTFKINMGSILTDGAANFAISPVGNVGIGTSTPGTTLDVNGSISSASDINLGGNFVSAITGPFNVDPVASDTRIITLDGGPINDIAAGMQGQEVILVSLAAGVDIIDADNGGFNIQLANNDTNFLMNTNATLHLVYMGSFWIEIGRSAQP